MGCLNSCHNHQKEEATGAHKPPNHNRHDAEDPVATAIKAFEERWLANPGNTATYDQFTNLKTLGSSYFGPNILVKHESSEKLYMMRILSQHKVVKQKAVEQMAREKRILQAVNHPNILTIDFHFKDNANLYLVQEHCPAQFYSYLRLNGRFREETTCFYAAQIVLAFEYLHSLDVIYRNLAPENLLLDHQGYLKITCFEFAKRVEGRTWSLCGTPEYMAPYLIFVTFFTPTHFQA